MGKNVMGGQPAAQVARSRTTANPGKRFRKDQKGAAALEFALCAPVFFLMVFSLFEVGLNYTADRLFNIGLDSAARKIRTGELRSSPTYGQNEFKQEICNHPVMFLFDCSKVLVDVRVVAQFEESSYETDEDGNVVTDDFGFSPGGRTTINVVQAFYPWPTVLNWNQFGQVKGWQFEGFEDNTHIIAASTAFLNEPFD